MAWTAPTTRSTSDLITASIWNTDLTDNLAYLKTQTDLIDDCVPAVVTGSRALDTLTYQAAKKLFVAATIITNRATDSIVYGYAKIGATSPAATTVATISSTNTLATASDQYHELAFVVPVGYYYGVSSQKIAGAVTLFLWTEWAFH